MQKKVRWDYYFSVNNFNDLGVKKTPFLCPQIVPRAILKSHA